MEETPLQKLSEKLSLSNQNLDKWLKRAKNTQEQLIAKHNPRRKFNSWRVSADGKLWKKQQFEKQNGCCAICRSPIPLKGSHIDHIQPLANAPELALEIKNIRITCPECNLSRNSSV